MIKQIEERLSQLKQERDAYLNQCNQQLAAYGAAIGELERLLATVNPDPIKAASEETVIPEELIAQHSNGQS